MKGIFFLELGFRNFQSYGNNLTIISLNFLKPTVISGLNVDASVEGYRDSNGAGKSTILNALSYVLYDTTIAKIKMDNLINWYNEKNMEVYVIFQKGDLFYKIERFRKFTKKGGNGIKIYCNTTGVFTDTDKDIAQSRNANDQIVEILGTPFDVFVRTVSLSSSTTSFFKLPPTDKTKVNQKDILEELFGYTEISEKADKLKESISTNKKEIDRLFDLNKQILDESARLESQIEFSTEESAKWEAEAIEERIRLEQSIKKDLEIDFDEERLIFDQIKKIETKIQENILLVREKELALNSIEKSKHNAAAWDNSHKREIAQMKTVTGKLEGFDFDEQIELAAWLENHTAEYDKLETDLYGYKKALAQLNSLITEKKEELSQLEHNTCPYCKQELLDVKEKINGLNKLISVSIRELEDITQTITTVSQQLVDLKAQIKEKEEQTAFTSVAKATAEKIRAENLFKRLAELEAETNPHTYEEDDSIVEKISELKNTIGSLRSKIDKFKCVQRFSSERDLLDVASSLQTNQRLLENLNERKNPHLATIEKLKKTVLPANKNKEIQDLEVYVEHQDFLYKLLTKKDSYIRKSLLNKNLPFLNNRLRHYLSKTGLQYKVSITDSMTADISTLGKPVDYENLSKGQKCRIDLAISFAFRDVLQARHEKINLCMLDEFLDDGLSTAGVSMAIKMLKEIAREEKMPMFIISHKEEVAAMFDSKVEVELNKKFSNIVRADIPVSTIM